MDIRKKFFIEGGETLERVDKRSCRQPITRGVQGKVGGGDSKQPNVVKDVLAHDKGVRLDLRRSLLTQIILRFQECFNIAQSNSL